MRNWLSFSVVFIISGISGAKEWQSKPSHNFYASLKAWLLFTNCVLIFFLLSQTACVARELFENNSGFKPLHGVNNF